MASWSETRPRAAKPPRRNSLLTRVMREVYPTVEQLEREVYGRRPKTENPQTGGKR